MKIGYLHIQKSISAESGVTRYGRLLAQTAKAISGIEVFQSSVQLSSNQKQNSLILTDAAKYLSQADLIHIQYSKYLWGSGRDGFLSLKAFLDNQIKPIAITLHDIYPDIYPNSYKHIQRGFLFGIIEENYRLRKKRNFKSLAIRSTLKSVLDGLWLDNYVLQSLLLNHHIVVSSHEEKLRLQHFENAQNISVIPHFIEDRDLTMSHLYAKKNLGLQDYTVITLQGFISPQKGHQILLDAIPHLPENTIVIFAGGVTADNESFLKRLLRKAKTLNIQHRLRVTGYLSDENLIEYLQATDLAVCPFKDLSASGSLSTWISLGRPILASDLPQIRDYNAIEPNAIQLFNPYQCNFLADAIIKVLEMDSSIQTNKLQSLKRKLSLSNTFNQYLDIYHQKPT